MQAELAKHGIDSTIIRDDNPRTGPQNNSLHLSFRQFAEEINDAGYSLTKAIEMGLLHLEMPWTEDNIKRIFRAIMLHRYPDKKWKNPEKPSTTELNTKELSECWEILNKAMGERFSVTLPFPSQESLYYEAMGYGK